VRFIRPLEQRAAGLLLCARRKGDIDRLSPDRLCSSTEPQHGAQQQMRVVPRLQLTLEAVHRLVGKCDVVQKTAAERRVGSTLMIYWAGLACLHLKNDTQQLSWPTPS